MRVFHGVGDDFREGERDRRGLRGADEAMLGQRPLQMQLMLEDAGGLVFGEQVAEHPCEIHVVLLRLPADRAMQPRNPEKSAVVQAQHVEGRLAR